MRKPHWLADLTEWLLFFAAVMKAGWWTYQVIVLLHHLLH